MAVTLNSNTISGLAAGGLDSGVVTAATIAGSAVTAAKLANGGSYSIGGSSDAATSGGGYHKFPNGIIMQWSSYGGQSSESTYTYSYPIAFPNACFRVTCGSTTVDASRDAMFQLDSFNTSNFTVFQNTINNAGGTQYCHMLAFGY